MENLITRITVDVCAVTSVTDNVQSMGSSNTMVNNIVTTVASILYISFSPLLENDPMSNPLVIPLQTLEPCCFGLPLSPFLSSSKKTPYSQRLSEETMALMKLWVPFGKHDTMHEAPSKLGKDLRFQIFGIYNQKKVHVTNYIEGIYKPWLL